MAKRTNAQNRAIYVNFELIAEALNDAGYDVATVLQKKPMPVPWTPQSVKEQLWKPAQKAYLNKDSTADLERKEVDEVDQIVKRFLAQEFGVDAGGFPSIEQIMMAQLEDNQ